MSATAVLERPKAEPWFPTPNGVQGEVDLTCRRCGYRSIDRLRTYAIVFMWAHIEAAHPSHHNPGTLPDTKGISMTDICQLDLLTTGPDTTHEIFWAQLRIGEETYEWNLLLNELGSSDPDVLEAASFHSRHPQGNAYAGELVYHDLTQPVGFAHQLAALTHGRTLTGTAAAIDCAGKSLRASNVAPSWLTNEREAN